MPISTPDDFATELAEGGRFYTQGFPEDTDAISDGLFDEDEFLAQAAQAAEEIRDIVADSADFAQSDPEPDVSELYTDILL